MNIRKLLTCFLCLFSTNIYAYQFEVESFPLGSLDSPVHEQMTMLAAKCLLRHNGIKPSNCISQGLTIDDANLSYVTDVINLNDLAEVTIIDIMRATRWPDDPTRLTKSGNKRKTAAKSVVTKMSACIPWQLTWRFPFFYKSDMTRNIIGGLFCNSHFGSMQFLHAMGSRSAEYDFKQEPFESSLTKALAWGNFSMRFFHTPSLRTVGLCEYFDKIIKEPTKSQQHEFASVFKLSDDSLAKGLDSNQFHCSNGLALRALFDNECTKLFSNETCNVVSNDKTVTLAALGATLHMIQDSYSTSHTVRTLNTANMNITTVYCRAVTSFFEYSSQSADGSNHADSDKPPVKFDDSCFEADNPITDPITASAIVLWYAAQSSYLDSNFRDFLANEVFGISPM